MIGAIVGTLTIIVVITLWFKIVLPLSGQILPNTSMMYVLPVSIILMSPIILVVGGVIIWLFPKI